MTHFYDQPVAWRTCGAEGRLSCTGVRVPLGYAQPDRRTLNLAVARRAATKAPRLGRCSPTRAARAIEEDSRRFGQSCPAGTGDLLAHVSTQKNARDIDLLREVLGEARVSYVGQSSGTMLGASYAELFPGRLGRFVLDAGVDVTGTVGIASVLRFDRARDAFASRCLVGGNHRWGASKPEVIWSNRALLDDLDARPLRVGDRPFTQSLAGTGIACLLSAGTLDTPVLDAALGGRNDPATPCEESVDVGSGLGPAVLVTFEGQGHVAHGGRSACIDGAVQRHLFAGTPAPDRLRCEPPPDAAAISWRLRPPAIVVPRL